MKAFPSFVFVVLAAGAANAQSVRKRRKLPFSDYFKPPVEEPLATCENGITQGCLDQTCSTAERDCYFFEFGKCAKEKTLCDNEDGTACEEMFDFCKLEHDLDYGPDEDFLCTTAFQECKDNCGVYSHCEDRCEMIFQGTDSLRMEHCEGLPPRSLMSMSLETIAGGESMPLDEQEYECDMEQLREEDIFEQCIEKCEVITEKSSFGDFSRLGFFFDKCKDDDADGGTGGGWGKLDEWLGGTGGGDTGTGGGTADVGSIFGETGSGTADVGSTFGGTGTGFGTGGDRTGGDRTGGDRTGADRTGGDRTGGDRTGGDRTGGGGIGGGGTGGGW